MRKSLAFLVALSVLAGCETKSTQSSPTVGGSLRASEPPPRAEPVPYGVAEAALKGGSSPGGAPGGDEAAAAKARALFDGDTRGLKDAPGSVSAAGPAGTKKVSYTAETKPDTLRISEPPTTLLAGPFQLGDLSDPVPRSPLDRVFYHYAACFGMDWRFLKTVAEAESSLDPRNGVGKKYVGLFQLDGTNTKESCSEYAGPFSGFMECSKLEDPEVNTALAAHRFDRYFTGQMNFSSSPMFPPLLKACPHAAPEALAALAYIGHNNGPGVLGHIMHRIKSNKACKLSNQEAAVRAYYSDPAIGNTDGNYEIPKNGEAAKPCPNQAELQGKWSYHCISEDYGVTKWKYGVRRIANPLKKAGLTTLYPEGGKNPALCPAQRTPPGRLTSAELSKAD